MERGEDFKAGVLTDRDQADADRDEIGGEGIEIGGEGVSSAMP